MRASVPPDSSAQLRRDVYRYISAVLPLIELPIIASTAWLSPRPLLSLLSGLFFPVWGVGMMRLSARRNVDLGTPLLLVSAVNLGLFCWVSGPNAPAWLEGVIYLTALMYLVPHRGWRMVCAVLAISAGVVGSVASGRPPSDVFGIVLALVTFALLLFRTLRVVMDQNTEIDRLLHNVFPGPVAIQLKRQNSVQPVLYQSVSVLFTDFVGFTESAARMTPTQLVSELDDLFSRFDTIIERHGLEKLKTIGDAYMCAGGIPTPNKTHAIDCVLAAVEMRALISNLAEQRRAAGLPVWQLRLGIHTGSLVAGVIGSKRFAYDIWGDTVNTASRMESNSLPNEINISQQTYLSIREWFDCEYRGKQPVKGKGEVEMYFVRGLLPSLASAARSAEGNEEFRRRYAQLRMAS